MHRGSRLQTVSLRGAGRRPAAGADRLLERAGGSERRLRRDARPRARREGRGIQAAGRSADPGGPDERVAAAQVLPRRIRAYVVPASFAPAVSRTPMQIPTSTGQMRAMELVGTLEFTLKGQALSLGALVEAGAAPDQVVRAVHGSDQRGRDVRGGAVPGDQADGHRHLHDRLQSRVPAVLRLQPQLRLPVSAAVEPAARGSPRRRRSSPSRAPPAVR